MKNLASLISKKSVVEAIRLIDTTKPKLNKATRFHLLYNSKVYPPKEVVRFAAKILGIENRDGYRLAGGPSTNKHLEKLGFVIENFRAVDNQKQIIAKETRVARLCWNDNGWIYPSGRIGKSLDKNSHEGKFGYGHEEWLFDIGKVINGFHYGFLEPIRKQQQAYTGNTYDVWLYTIDSKTKKRYYVGQILNVKVIDEKEAIKANETYRNEGWLDEMGEQIQLSKANSKGFSDWKGVDLFNIKFRLSDVKFENYEELADTHPVHKISRYSFGHFKEPFKVLHEEKGTPFTFIPPSKISKSNVTKLTKKIFFREPKAVEITNLHKTISDNLVLYLRVIYGHSNVTPEHSTIYGSNRIDIVVKDNNRIIFFEIKTYASIQTSIREAFGQIMEYAHWTNYKNADELIIVTQQHNDCSDVKSYMTYIRNTFNLPIFYQAFDLDTNSLTKKY